MDGLFNSYKQRYQRCFQQCRWLSGTTSTSTSTPYSLVSVALLGPPNAGKSTLFNRLLDKNTPLRSNKKLSGRLLRPTPKHVPGTAIVSAVPGTTRDCKVSRGRIGSVEFQLFDTAGIDVSYNNSVATKKNMSKFKQQQQQEYDDSSSWIPNALLQTQRAARHADIVFLMIDGKLDHLTADVLDTAQWLRRRRREHNKDLNFAPRVVVLVNKMEHLVYGDYPPILQEAARLGFENDLVLDPIPISALHGEGLAEIAAVIQQVANEKQQQEKQQEGYTTEPMDDASTATATATVSSSSSASPVVLKLAILGRVNVGKSTLVNQLVQQCHSRQQQGSHDPKRNKGENDDDPQQQQQHWVLTGPTPGLTRDSISIECKWQDNDNDNNNNNNQHHVIQIVDTAGIRRGSKTIATTPATSITTTTTERSTSASSSDIESMAVQEAWHAVKTAEVAVLVIDAGARLLQRQELAICQAVLKEGRALVVAANKMDLVVVVDTDHNDKKKKKKQKANNDIAVGDDDDDDDSSEDGSYTKEQFADDVRAQLEARFPLLRKTPIVPMSALSGENVQALLPVVWKARERWQREIPTSQLNRWLKEVLATHEQPPKAKDSRKPVRIKYILQTKGRPPTFLLYCNTDQLPESYIRFLTRHFQDTFEMFGMEVRFAVKKTSNPYHNNNNSSKHHNHRIIGGGKEEGGMGVGGREARKQRMIRELKTKGVPFSKKKTSKNSRQTNMKPARPQSSKY